MSDELQIKKDDGCNVAAEFYRRQELFSNTALENIFVNECCLRHDQAVDCAAAVMENRALICGKSSNATATPTHSNTADLKRDFHKLREMLVAGWLNLERYVKQHGDRVMAERCLWLLIGVHENAGARDLAELVKRLGREKQTVNKCLRYFQEQMPELPILEGQRSQVARRNMTLAREKQLKSNKH